MTMRLTTVSLAVQLAILLPVRAFGAPAGEAVKKEMASLAKAVKEFAALRDTVAAELPVPAGQSQDNGCLEMKLAGAVNGNDLSIQLIRRQGAFTDGRAIAAGWNRIVGPVAFGDLRLAGGTLSGRVAVTLTPYGDKRNLADNIGKPFEAIYAVDARLDGTVLKGSAVLQNTKAAPLSPSPCAVQGRFVPAVRPRWATPGIPDLSESYLSDINWYENWANRIYEEVRAMAFQRCGGLPVGIATNEVLTYRIQRGEGSQATSSKKKAAQAAKEATEVPDIDGAGGDGGDVGTSPKRSSEDLGKVLAAIAESRERVVRLSEMVRAYQGKIAEPYVKVQTGDVDPGDPEFGPWFGAAPLPLDRDQRQCLPAADTDSRQRWPFVGKWRMSGPFPQSTWEFHLAELPEMVPAFSAKTLVEVNRLAQDSGTTYLGDGTAPWELVNVDTRNGGVLPPIYSKRKYPAYGMAWSHIFGATEIVSDRDAEIWAAVTVNDRGALWVNGRITWETGPNNHREEYKWYRFKVPLRKGVNNLLFRWTDDRPPQLFAMRVCTGGAPRSSDAVKASQEARRAFYAANPHPMKGTRGFMNDQTSLFPDAKPAMAWNTKTGANIAWHLPLRPAHSSPIVVGDVVYTVEEPFVLIAVDRKKGAILWKRDVDPLEVFKPAEFAKAKPLREALDKAEAEEAELVGAKQKDEARLAEVRKTIRETIGKLGAFYSPVGVPFSRGEAGYGGYFFATPITDGTNIWVKLGKEALACYDLAGKMKWMVPLGTKGGAMHEKSSPVLLGGKVICEICEDDKAPPASAKDDDDDDAFNANRRPNRHELLVAWDAATGKPVWRSPRYANPRIGNRYNAEGVVTPAVARLSNGKETMDVLIVAGGAVIRADDGVMVVPYVGFMNDFALPVVHEDRTHFWTQWSSSHGGVYGEVVGVQLLMHDRDWVGARYVGSACAHNTVYAMVAAGDRVFIYNGGAVDAIDPTKGKVVGHVNVPYGLSAGEAYVWPTIAGGHLFIGERGGWGMLQRDHNEFRGCMPVMRIDPELRLVARNFLQGMIGAPVFEGDRMYARTHDGLTCVGITGDEGRKYEAQETARTILAEWPRAKPDDAPPVDAKPMDAKVDDLKYAWVPSPGTMPMSWSVTDPIPLDNADAVRKAIGLPVGWLVKTDKIATPGMDPVTVRSIHHLLDSSHEGPWSRFWPYGPVLDVCRAANGAGKAVMFWNSRVRVFRETVFRVAFDAPDGTRIWLGTVELRNNQRVRLVHGVYNLVVESRLESPPAEGAVVRFRLLESDDPTAELAMWRARVQSDRDILERAAALLPETAIGKRAADALRW